jgi:hypothetical protein
MRANWIFGISLTAVLLQALAVRAEEADKAPLPKSQSLGCGSQCATFTQAQPLKHEMPEFPRREYMGFYNTNSEGYVWLRYTIGVDGKTHDISKIYELGKPEFAQRVIETITNWTFQPALANGKPVTQSKMFSDYFQLGNPSPTRPIILDAYKKANDLFDAGKIDEASAVLQEALAQLRLSMQERSMLTMPLAKIALRRQEYLQARRYALPVTLPGAKPLPSDLTQGFLEILISADVRLGEMNEAINAFNALRRMPGFYPNSPYVDLIMTAGSQFQHSAQLVSQAEIPPQGAGGLLYWHGLSRHTFSFAAIEGSLDKYILNCEQSATESKISPTAQWRVPASWKNCNIFVYGTPGTTFRIVETADEQ